MASELYVLRRDMIEGLLMELDDKNDAAIIRKWFKESDFYYAPASSKYHLNETGGLAQHSINVFNNLKSINSTTGGLLTSDEVVRIALLHDVCKIDYYVPKIVTSRVEYTKEEYAKLLEKNVTKKGVPKKTKPAKTYPVDTLGFEIENELPLGHGSKSIYLCAKKGLNLNDEELVSICWHMAHYERYYSYPIQEKRLTKKFPSHKWIQHSDQISTTQEDME